MNIEIGGDPATGDIHIIATIQGQKRAILSLRPKEVMPFLQSLVSTVAQHPDIEVRKALYQHIQPSDWKILGSSGSGVHLSYKASSIDGGLEMPAEMVRALAAALDGPPMSAQ
jgi:hypothetical protein